MDGKPLIQAFDREVQLDVIDSWEDVPGDCGMHGAGEINQPWIEQDAMDQLVALGYIEPPDENVQKAVENTVRESKFYLARVYLHKNDYDNALPLLEELYEKYPEQTRFGLKLANCYHSLQRIADCRRVVDEVVAILEKPPEKIDAERRGMHSHAERGNEGTEGNIAGNIHEKAGKSRISKASFNLLQGTLLLAEEKPEEALEYLEKVLAASPRLPNLHQQLGNVYMKMQKWQDAEAAFFQALEIDGDSAAAYHGLAMVYLQRKLFQDAAEAAMTSIGLIYHNPSAHYHLGEALFRLGDFEKAALSWEVAVRQAPGLQKAHERLVDLYQRYLSEPMKSVEHQRFIDEKIKPARENSTRSVEAGIPTQSVGTRNSGVQDLSWKEVVTVVSGLPRSGTSMVMQMLQQGGMEILTDGVREADENNVRGYFEDERVKKLAQDKEWLLEAKGRAVKVIAQLLPFLDRGLYYRVVFMDRDLGEILKSQDTMLDALGKTGANPETLAKTFQQQLEKIRVWLADQENIDVLFVSYHEVLANPLLEAERINEFLGGVLDVRRSAGAVDKGLYRARV
jgi:tetratricopeptide (TPR) repeat protein